MNVRRSIAVAAAVVAAPALVSCGFDAPTNLQYNPTVGVYSKAGAVDVLNAVVVSPEDGRGTLVTTLANNDDQVEDRLVSVTGTGVDETLEVSVSGETTVPAGGILTLSEDSDVTLTGEDIKPGFFVELTYSFDNAESITLKVPVEDWGPDGPYSEVITD